MLVDALATGALALVVVALLVATLLVAADFLDAGLLAALIMSSRPAFCPASDICARARLKLVTRPGHKESNRTVQCKPSAGVAQAPSWRGPKLEAACRV